MIEEGIFVSEAKGSPFNAGFLVKYDYGQGFLPSEGVTAPQPIVKAISLIQQLGFLSEGEAFLQVSNFRKRSGSVDIYSIRVGSIILVNFSIYAKQIVNVEFENKSFTAEELVKMLFSEAKKAFSENIVLTKKSLGRFCLLRLAGRTDKYSRKEIATLALSEVKSETLVSMMNNGMPVEAILDMEEIPDSWLQTMLDKFA